MAGEDKTPPKAAVVSAHHLATKAGMDILAKGGNAYDAAVAVSAMLGVVEPLSSGIGGGGFWLLYEAKTKGYNVIDARETAPLATKADMYLDEKGEVIKGISTKGALAAGIPGLPAAFVAINKKYGSMKLGDVLTPAVKVAREGFAVDERYINGAHYKRDMFLENEEAASIFLDNGNVPKDGWILKQRDLANTLESIAIKGLKGFYDGDIAAKMVNDVVKHGGIWSLGDLRDYHVIERNPVIMNYRGARIIAPPLPSSGGLVLSNIFNILSGFDLTALSSANRKHVIIEAMRHAYYNRALYMGDSDFVDVPVDYIISKEMSDKQRKKIDMDKALPSALLSLSFDNLPKGTDTTHFAVIDKWGNRVAVTQSINFWGGSGFVPKGTGVLLNNEMDDFTIKVGVENGYGLQGTKANEIAPNKRMLSSMTPTFVENERGVLIVGTPGGSRIISMNLLGILNYIDGKSAKGIVAAARYHHQFMPDEVVYEQGAFNAMEVKALEAKGHTLKKQSSSGYGNMQVILWDYTTGEVTTASDPRGVGAGRVY